MSEQPHLFCETCRYFDVRGGNGICRRHPPRVFAFQSERGDHVSVTEWPQVMPDEWCGEIEPRYRTSDRMCDDQPHGRNGFRAGAVSCRRAVA